MYLKYCGSAEFKPVSPLAGVVYQACVSEINALKPGNVSVYAAGHDMTADDFIKSAASIANIMAALGLRLGERIFKSIEATQNAVGCNTNLGIVLLCAPLTQCAIDWPLAGRTLRENLAHTLRQLDKEDSRQVFQAIRLVKPAGLGQSERHDVHHEVSAGLLEIMREAAGRDRIAYQYANDFIDIFDTGLKAWRQAQARGLNETWACVEVYLNFLTRFQDTHIRRKLGEKTAIMVQREAQQYLQGFQNCANPEQMTTQLLEFDQHLKQRGINPGTSADLTVATLLSGQMLRLTEHDFKMPATCADNV